MLICIPQQPWEQNIKPKQDSPPSFLKKFFWQCHPVFRPGIEPGPQYWKSGLLTTRQPRNSQDSSLLGSVNRLINISISGCLFTSPGLSFLFPPEKILWSSNSPVPQAVTLFGNGVIADRASWDHPEVQWVPNGWWPYKRIAIWKQRHIASRPFG